jgi:hypothetical protein
MDAPADQSRIPRRRFQYSVKTLLAIITLAAGLCSIGVCTRWYVPVAVMVLAIADGGLGSLITRNRRGFAWGVFFGLFLSTTLLIRMMIPHFAEGYFPRGKARNNSIPPVDSRMANEIVKSIQTHVPSATSCHQDLKADELLTGFYDNHDSSSLSERLCLFPDKTFLYLLNGDGIHDFQGDILDRGTWEFKNGLLYTYSDDAIPCDEYYPTNKTCVYIPLKNYPLQKFSRTNEKEERFLLFRIGDNFKVYREAAKRDTSDTLRWEGPEKLLQWYSFTKIKEIKMEDINAIKEDLYANNPPSFDRIAWKQKLWKNGMALMVLVAMTVVAFVLIPRRKKKNVSIES